MPQRHGFAFTADEDEQEVKCTCKLQSAVDTLRFGGESLFAASCDVINPAVWNNTQDDKQKGKESIFLVISINA